MDRGGGDLLEEGIDRAGGVPVPFPSQLTYYDILEQNRIYYI